LESEEMKFADIDEIDRAWELVQALRLAVQQHRIAMARAKGGVAEPCTSRSEPTGGEPMRAGRPAGE